VAGSGLTGASLSAWSLSEPSFTLRRELASVSASVRRPSVSGVCTGSGVAAEPLEVWLFGQVVRVDLRLTRPSACGGGGAGGDVMLSLALLTIFVTRPTDMRKSFDSLAALCVRPWSRSLSGHLFCFVRVRRPLEAAVWTRTACDLAKRLEEGRFSCRRPTPRHRDQGHGPALIWRVDCSRAASAALSTPVSA